MDAAALEDSAVWHKVIDVLLESSSIPRDTGSLVAQPFSVIQHKHKSLTLQE